MLAFRWLFAFAITQVVEMGIYVQAFGPQRSVRERLTLAFVMSAVTHPIVVYVIPDLVYDFVADDYWTMVVFAEAFAVLAEAAMLAVLGLGFKRGLLWSLAANACSFTMGMFIYSYTPPELP